MPEAKKLLTVDTKLKPWEQSPPLHNRWHPDIPPVATVEEGEVFKVECALSGDESPRTPPVPLSDRTARDATG